MSEYDVGFKKPPKEHRFRKGRSGNPNGRPRKQPDVARAEALAAVMKRADGRQIVVNGNDYIPFELEVMALQAKAAKGDVPASRQLSKLRKDLGLLAPTPAAVGGVLVVPAPLERPEDFDIMAARQQAQFRERRVVPGLEDDADECGK